MNSTITKHLFVCAIFIGCALCCTFQATAQSLELLPTIKQTRNALAKAAITHDTTQVAKLRDSLWFGLENEVVESLNYREYWLTLLYTEEYALLLDKIKNFVPKDSTEEKIKLEEDSLYWRIEHEVDEAGLSFLENLEQLQLPPLDSEALRLTYFLFISENEWYWFYAYRQEEIDKFFDKYPGSPYERYLLLEEYLQLNTRPFTFFAGIQGGYQKIGGDLGQNLGPSWMLGLTMDWNYESYGIILDANFGLVKATRDFLYHGAAWHQGDDFVTQQFAISGYHRFSIPNFNLEANLGVSAMRIKPTLDSLAQISPTLNQSPGILDRPYQTMLKMGLDIPWFATGDLIRLTDTNPVVSQLSRHKLSYQFLLPLDLFRNPTPFRSAIHQVVLTFSFANKRYWKPTKV